MKGSYTLAKMKHLQLLILANHQEMSPLASPFDLLICFTGFVRSLEFLKKSRVCPAIFQTWKKSGRIVKVWIFFFQTYNKLHVPVFVNLES